MIACTLCGSGNVTVRVHNGVKAKGVTVVRCAHCDTICPLGRDYCRLCKNVHNNKRDAPQ